MALGYLLFSRVARNEQLTAAAYSHLVSFLYTHTKCCFFIPEPISHAAQETLDDDSSFTSGRLKQNRPADGWAGSVAGNPCKFHGFLKSNDDKHGSGRALEGLKFK